MKIQKPDELFSLYIFEDELKIKIIQAYNAKKGVVPRINALCIKAKIDNLDDKYFRYLHRNFYLIKIR